jgi:glutathione S-transferase
MAEGIRLYNLKASPNNKKVRIALNFKGLPYESVAVDPKDRAPVVEVSGQPLTPVLVHRDTVVFDSAAILRYLDANLRDTPPLFSSDYATMKEIERWEHAARGEGDLAGPVGIAFKVFLSGGKGEDELKRASELLRPATERVERRLSESAWLVDGRMTAADVTAACALWYATLVEPLPEDNPFARFFFEHLQLGDDRDRTRDWVKRVIVHDR